MKRCKKCKREIYKRDDGSEMVRIWGVYDDRFDWHD